MESCKVIPVRVAVRSRPPVSKELIEGCQTCTRTIPGKQCIVLGGDKTFTFDYVFGEQSSQLEVYEACISDLLPKISRAMESGKVIPVRVAVRSRPLVSKELIEGCQTCTRTIPGQQCIVLGGDKTFTYDYVFGEQSSQLEISRAMESGKVIPVHVAVRSRPLVSKELIEGCQTCTRTIPGQQCIVLGGDKTFTYDYVFGEQSRQLEISRAMESCKVIPVRVAVRSRPPVSKELIEGCQTCTRTIPGQQCIVLGGDKTFTFDYVFGEQSSQLEVYEACISDLLPKVFEDLQGHGVWQRSSVHVAVRSRPLVSKELIEGCQTCTRTIPGQQCIVLGGDKTFTYDYVFGEQSRQLEISRAMESGKVFPVRVAVRSRPLVSKELIDGCQTCTRTIPGQQCNVLGGDKTFTFDYVFGEQSSQLEVYEACISDLFPKYSKISRAMKSGEVIPVDVAVRSRPLVSKELIEGCQTCTRTIPGQQCIVLGGDKTFTYDYVFGEQPSQL
ncbi:hypothetical protein MRX96_006946 [Rhipicephalus microplus]